MNLTSLAQIAVDWSQWSKPFTALWAQETLCCVLVGVACGVLGCFVVLRRMALIGDALAHAVLPGVVVAFMLTGSVAITQLLLGALAAGLLSALLITFVHRWSRTKEDSSIGIVFTAFFALGIVLFSALPRSTHFDLKCFLFGDPLAVGPQDLLMMAVIAPLVVLVVVALYHPLKLVSFDPTVAAAMGLPVAFFHYLLMGMLSATVVAGLKTTGVILVVAMVITPASAAYQLTNRLSVMIVLSALFGAISAAAGMSLAFVTNSPTGPAMVLAASLLFVATMFFSPSHGIVSDALRRRWLSGHIALEDVLKTAYRLTELNRPTTLAAVAQAASLPQGRVLSLARRLSEEGLVRVSGQDLSLTEGGRQRAGGMVRSHRLWEAYLVQHARIDPGSIHDEAERLEHAHGLTDELSRELGDPTIDPQGKPIPPASEVGRDVVFYDGHCGLCHSSVKFLLRRDPQGQRFVFAPQQGESFRDMLSETERHELSGSVIVLTRHGRKLTRSTAVLHMLRRLDAPWPTCAAVLGIVPRPLRDAGYGFVAAIRRWVFARPKDVCPLVPEGWRGRFLR